MEMGMKIIEWVKEKPVKRGIITFLTLLVIVPTLWWGVSYAMWTIKVKDPNDPRFDPYKFEFRDYPSPTPENYKKFKASLHQMFPFGTSKKYVEIILVGCAGAGIYKNENRLNNFSYVKSRFFRHPQIWMWTINVEYDDKNKLRKLKLSGGGSFASSRLDSADFSQKVKCKKMVSNE